MFPSEKLTVKDENILLAFHSDVGFILVEVVKYDNATHFANIKKMPLQFYTGK